MAKAAVVLSGCGVFDGSELHEAVLTLYHLDRNGVEYKCFAPDIPQMHVIDHTKGEETGDEIRNVLVESARIARGEIEPLSKLLSTEYDAVIFPGGFGAAKNLCDYAMIGGPDVKVDKEVEDVIIGFHGAGKTVAAMCIAPVILARVFGSRGKKVKLTIGNDENTAGHLEKMGAEHVNCGVEDIVCDEELKVVTTPAYMLGPGISDIGKGIEKLVLKVKEFAG